MAGRRERVKEFKRFAEFGEDIGVIWLEVGRAAFQGTESCTKGAMNYSREALEQIIDTSRDLADSQDRQGVIVGHSQKMLDLWFIEGNKIMETLSKTAVRDWVPISRRAHIAWGKLFS